MEPQVASSPRERDFRRRRSQESRAKLSLGYIDFWKLRHQGRGIQKKLDIGDKGVTEPALELVTQ